DAASALARLPHRLQVLRHHVAPRRGERLRGGRRDGARRSRPRRAAARRRGGDDPGQVPVRREHAPRPARAAAHGREAHGPAVDPGARQAHGAALRLRRAGRPRPARGALVRGEPLDPARAGGRHAGVLARGRAGGALVVLRRCPRLAYAGRSQMSVLRKWTRSAANLLLAREGRLTSELELTPGGHGLGRVPTRLKPERTSTSVCGFCSTGGGLRVHLRGGEAINLSPDTEYPVNLGMACPKGWEALAPLSASDRGTVPLVKNAKGKLTASTWEEAVTEMVAR